MNNLISFTYKYNTIFIFCDIKFFFFLHFLINLKNNYNIILLLSISITAFCSRLTLLDLPKISILPSDFL